MSFTLLHILQVVVGDDEPPENALKRFRWATKSTGLVQEVRSLFCYMICHLFLCLVFALPLSAQRTIYLGLLFVGKTEKVL